MIIPLSRFALWRDHFETALAHPIPLPEESHLTEAERALITPSIQQFQLGESSEGRRLLARGRALGDPDFADALALFIREEQRHSAELGRFMDHEGIPRLKHDPVDGAFRWLRNLAGLELTLRVLSAAEMIAVPYYSALRDATGSPWLKALCARILEDEAAHLRYQRAMLERLSAGRPGWLRRVAEAGHFLALLGAVALVWKQHAGLLRAGGYTLPGFARAAMSQFQTVTAASRGRSRGGLPPSSR